MKGGGLKAGLNTARAAMERRDVELTQEGIDLIKYTHALTNDARMELIKRSRKKRFGK